MLLMVTQKNNLANPPKSRSVSELAAEAKCYNIALELIFLLFQFTTPSQLHLCDCTYTLKFET